MTSDATNSALTAKQQRFVESYLLDLNATQAAIRAGYSRKTANEQGSQLLNNPAIKTAIDAAKTERSVKTEIHAEQVLQEIAAMAFYDPGKLMIDGKADADDPIEAVIDGRVIYGLRCPADIKRLPEKLRRAIVGWGYDRNQNFTVKLADKSKALDQLARHLSLYNYRLEVTGFDALAERLARAAKRTSEKKD
jgi:phage terminase small subunit